MQITPETAGHDRELSGGETFVDRGSGRPRHQHPLRHLLAQPPARGLRRQRGRRARRLQRGPGNVDALGRRRAGAGRHRVPRDPRLRRERARAPRAVPRRTTRRSSGSDLLGPAATLVHGPLGPLAAAVGWSGRSLAGSAGGGGSRPRRCGPGAAARAGDGGDRRRRAGADRRRRDRGAGDARDRRRAAVAGLGLGVVRRRGVAAGAGRCRGRGRRLRRLRGPDRALRARPPSPASSSSTTPPPGWRSPTS